jgi:hypothetical protein
MQVERKKRHQVSSAAIKHSRLMPPMFPVPGPIHATNSQHQEMKYEAKTEETILKLQ